MQNRVKVVCIGHTTTDNLIKYDGTCRFESTGGAGVYAASGASYWGSDHDVGLVTRLGSSYNQSCIEHIRRGDLGEIYSINAEMSTFHPPEYRQWLRHFPGGIMYILGSHLIDLIVYILGEPERCDAYLHRTGLDGVDVPDLTLAVLSYKKALARVFVSSVEVNGWGRRQFSVAGSRGTIQIMPIERKCAMTYTDTAIATNAYADQKEIVDAPDVPDNIRYDAMMRDFYDFVQGTKQNPFTYAHELRVQKVLTQITGELTL